MIMMTMLTSGSSGPVGLKETLVQEQ
ncbi:hypothetical protein LINPERHAP2_LOCUS33852 [Linum perenne]